MGLILGVSRNRDYILKISVYKADKMVYITNNKQNKVTVHFLISMEQRTVRHGKGQRQPGETVFSKQVFLASLSKNLGLVYRASKDTGIPSTTHYQWLDKDPIYKEKVEKLIELKRDYVENQLISLVDDKEASCVTFTAKCLLRKRGYDQSTEIKNADDKPFEIAISADIVSSALKTIYEKADDPTPNP
jgi:hypothetical protein